MVSVVRDFLNMNNWFYLVCHTCQLPQSRNKQGKNKWKSVLQSDVQCITITIATPVVKILASPSAFHGEPIGV